jgi:hypothetical protein
VLETKKPGLEDRAFCVTGAENRNRTYDLRVTSALLYRLSYFGNYVEGEPPFYTAKTQNATLKDCRYDLQLAGARDDLSSAARSVLQVHAPVAAARVRVTFFPLIR